MTRGLPLATSAGYATSTQRFVIVGQILAGTGTSTVDDFEMIPPQQTSAGVHAAEAPPANAALFEIRRLSGLSWEQLARIFDVSRRALHFWASGKPMTRANEEHLQRTLAAVRAIDRGSAAANRTALLEALDADEPAVDLLARHEYDRVVSIASRVSASARRARIPPPPEELVAAHHDNVHHDRGPGRPVRSVKVERKK